MDCLEHTLNEDHGIFSLADARRAEVSVDHGSTTWSLKPCWQDRGSNGLGVLGAVGIGTIEIAISSTADLKSQVVMGCEKIWVAELSSCSVAESQFQPNYSIWSLSV